MGGGIYSETETRRTNDIIGQELVDEDSRLYFYSGEVRHPVRVLVTRTQIIVGCVTISKSAWKLLKLKIDGEGN